jgi:hypothetical protein
MLTSGHEKRTFLRFFEQLTLLRCGGVREEQSSEQAGIEREPVEVIQERVNSSCCEMRSHSGNNRARALGVCCQRVGDAALRGEVFGAIGEEPWVGIKATKRD